MGTVVSPDSISVGAEQGTSILDTFFTINPSSPPVVGRSGLPNAYPTDVGLTQSNLAFQVIVEAPPSDVFTQAQPHNPTSKKERLPELVDRLGNNGVDRAMMEETLDDFLEAFEKLHHLPPSVSVFGGARVKPGTAEYELARQTGAKLGELGFGVITGGGPGVMEAAAKGGREAGSITVGLNIKLPHEQAPNPYLDLVVDFDYFFPQKVMFAKLSEGFIVGPGGFGTIDELFEILTLRQTGKMPHLPVVLLGKEFWEPLVGFIRDKMFSMGYISQKDLDDIFITDSPADAAEFILKHAPEKPDAR